jgi:hypothetical protein
MKQVNIWETGSMDRPPEPFHIGDNSNQLLQQLKTQISRQPTSTAAAPRALNLHASLPQPVSNITVSRQAISATQHKVTVRFTPTGGDTQFKSANVYLKQGNGTPNLVASTEGNSVSFVTNKSHLSSNLIVQSVGSVASIPVVHSPTKVISLK